MTKSLLNKLYLKKSLHQMKMEEGMSIKEHVSLFTKTVLDLKSIDVEIMKKIKQSCYYALCHPPLKILWTQ